MLCTFVLKSSGETVQSKENLLHHHFSLVRKGSCGNFELKFPLPCRLSQRRSPRVGACGDCTIIQSPSINPLTTEFFPPRQHIFMHSAHTTFVGTPLPQHSLLSGQTWWGSHTWRDPSGNTVNDIHDPHKPSNRRSKVDVSWIFAQHFPKLGPDLTDGTP